MEVTDSRNNLITVERTRQANIGYSRLPAGKLYKISVWPEVPFEIDPCARGIAWEKQGGEFFVVS